MQVYLYMIWVGIPCRSHSAKVAPAHVSHTGSDRAHYLGRASHIDSDWVIGFAHFTLSKRLESTWWVPNRICCEWTKKEGCLICILRYKCINDLVGTINPFPLDLHYQCHWPEEKIWFDNDTYGFPGLLGFWVAWYGLFSGLATTRVIFNWFAFRPCLMNI